MIKKSFVIYGERNSGTNYLETVLTGQSYHLFYPQSAFIHIPVLNTSYFDDYKIPTEKHTVRKNNFGAKHFFGFYDENIKIESDVIFIGIVRNPYDWITALNRDNHHIPPENHGIVNFLSNEWYSIDHLIRNKTYGEELMEDRDFETGLRYENIFKMRSKKLHYLYNTMPNIAKNYELIKYEDFCNDPWSIVTEWSNKYHIPMKMPIMEPIEKKPYHIEPEIKQIIDKGIDWEIENKLGYFIKE